MQALLLRTIKPDIDSVFWGWVTSQPYPCVMSKFLSFAEGLSLTVLSQLLFCSILGQAMLWAPFIEEETEAQGR